MSKLRGHQSECIACGLRFLTVRAFDAHRSGDHGVHEGTTRGRCRGEDELRAVGLHLDERGFWRFPIRAYDGPRNFAGSSGRVA